MMKKILAGLAASLVALSAMAFVVSAEGTEDETPAPIDTVATEAPVDTEATEATSAESNPGTGNAPIALAAIPVALAAAAVVAKKAK